MKPGDIVTIYNKPITKEYEEGKARLILEIGKDLGDGLSMWEVEFLDEPGYTFWRWVYQDSK